MSYFLETLGVEIFMVSQRYVIIIAAVMKIPGMEMVSQTLRPFTVGGLAVQLKVNAKRLVELDTRRVYSFQITCDAIKVRSDQCSNFQFYDIVLVYKTR